MQIHTDGLTGRDLYRAAQIARVDIVKQESQGSRIRDRKFNINLEGESRRRPNQRGNHYGFAATWDQWGVFLAVLFDLDPDMVCGPSIKHAYYKDRDDFHHKTNDRFRARSVVGQARTFIDIPQGETVDYWPADAHGDHTFKYDGIPREQHCTKCSAVCRW